FLSEEDISKMATALNLDRQSFITTYCRYVEMGAMKMISLIEKDNYDCIFLTEKGCKVYESRPRQCETYPFWSHVLESEETWNEEAKHCPGINKGRKYTKREIEKKLKNRQANCPVVIF
ncbi:MAG: YkgJ family cysteine cluster protein, partial [Sphaerochaetaceae bacterium]|nr:YkgJ family cysteine cluster protein [Sphaerochaetaceae bacterium]